MRDLKSSTFIKLKAVLFLLAGLLSCVLLIADHPTLKTVFLLTVAIWSFCRLYYFLFYVMEHYLQSNRRFSGMFALVCHLMTTRKA